MPRLDRLPQINRNNLLAFPAQVNDTSPFARPSKPLSALRLAIVTTAGLHCRGDRAFSPGDQTYRVIPSDAAATTLAGKASTSPSPLVPGQAGSATFTVQNSSRTQDGNVRVTLTFPKGADPDSIAGDGWVLESGGPLVWTFRRATLAARTGTTLKATWNLVPAVSSIPVAMAIESDGCASAGQTFTFSPQAAGTRKITGKSR